MPVLAFHTTVETGDSKFAGNEMVMKDHFAHICLFITASLYKRHHSVKLLNCDHCVVTNRLWSLRYHRLSLSPFYPTILSMSLSQRSPGPPKKCSSLKRTVCICSHTRAISLENKLHEDPRDKISTKELCHIHLQNKNVKSANIWSTGRSHQLNVSTLPTEFRQGRAKKTL